MSFLLSPLYYTTSVLFNKTVTQEKVNVTSLPPGTKITLNVTALTAGGKLEGETVTVVSYTSNSGLLV